MRKLRLYHPKVLGNFAARKSSDVLRAVGGIDIARAERESRARLGPQRCQGSLMATDEFHVSHRAGTR
jgi:hypothetical protein